MLRLKLDLWQMISGDKCLVLKCYITFNQIPTIYHKVHVLVGYNFLYIRKVNFNKSCKLYKIILCLFLQVEISLGDDCQYHSIFACPILRQQSTNSNHPVRLVCGHCISKDALTKLATANKYVSVTEAPPNLIVPSWEEISQMLQFFYMELNTPVSWVHPVLQIAENQEAIRCL